MILGFAHPAIVVDDLEKAEQFYANMFGFVTMNDESWARNAEIDISIGSKDSVCRGVMMAGHNCYLELFVFEQPEESNTHPSNLGSHDLGIRHLSFYVDSAEDECERFLNLGGSSLGTPHNGIVYLRDPFGNIIELCEFPSPEENLLFLPGISSLGTHN